MGLLTNDSSISEKKCIHLAPLPGTALVRTTTSINLGRHVIGLPRGVVSPAPRRGVHRPISVGEMQNFDHRSLILGIRGPKKEF